MIIYPLYSHYIASLLPLVGLKLYGYDGLYYEFHSCVIMLHADIGLLRKVGLLAGQLVAT